MPPFDPDTGYLPSGIHLACWQDVEQRLAGSEHRRRLLLGLRDAVLNLTTAGCRRVYLDGSFATAKPVPRDYDACWEVSGVDPERLDPIFLLPGKPGRQIQKTKYGGEWFPVGAHSARAWLGFFQHDREGVEKGILAMDLGMAQ